jgi:hypothetical protein
MSTVPVYQFEMYDVHSDVMRTSRRWGTIEGIREICGKELGPAVEVDKSAVESPESDLPGLTAIGFDPCALKGFQKLVNT